MKRSFFAAFAQTFALLVFVCACTEGNKSDAPWNSENSEGVTFTEYRVGDVLGPWEDGCLDIHFINTGRGECSFLIFPDGTTLIIDFAGSTYISESSADHSAQTPAKPSDDITSAEVIVNYINHFTSEVSRGHLDYALASHYHGDHIGTVETSMGRGGDGSFYLSSVCDIGVRLPYGHFFHRGDFLKPSTTIYNNLQDFLSWTASANGTVVEEFNPGGLNQISLIYDSADYPDFTIQNLCCAGCCWTGEGEDSEMTVPETYSDSDSQPDENCLSCALWLSFGKFDYYTGGDLQYNGKSTYSYKDSELNVAAVVGVMDVNKANHHGTQYCNSEELLAATVPSVWVANPWRDVHPNGDTVDRVLAANPQCKLYATNFGVESTASESDFVSTQGHVAIRVAPSADKYYVYVLEDSDFSFVVKNARSFACK